MRVVIIFSRVTSVTRRNTSCSTAAFGEVPAQVRLVGVDHQKIEIKSLSLARIIGLPDKLTPEKSWCVGPAAEHTLTIPLRNRIQYLASNDI